MASSKKRLEERRLQSSSAPRSNSNQTISAKGDPSINKPSREIDPPTDNDPIPPGENYPPVPWP